MKFIKNKIKTKTKRGNKIQTKPPIQNAPGWGSSNFQLVKQEEGEAHTLTAETALHYTVEQHGTSSHMQCVRIPPANKGH